MTTLADILYDVYTELGEFRSGIATGGSTTTVVDSSLAKDYGTDEFKYGTVQVEWDAGDADAAPQAEIREITGFTPSSGTITVGTAFSIAPATGDRYALASNEYPLNDVIRIVNQSLRRMGDVPLIDTSISTATGTREYTLPSGVDASKIRRVWVPSLTDDADDNGLRQNLDWYPMLGATYDLVFRSYPDASKTLHIQYMGRHPNMWALSDTLKTTVHPNLIVAEAVYRAFKWKRRSTNNVSDAMIDDLRDAASELEIARRLYRIPDLGTPMKPILTGNSRGRSNKYGPWLT
jgi:hypothetical protein